MIPRAFQRRSRYDFRTADMGCKKVYDFTPCEKRYALNAGLFKRHLKKKKKKKRKKKRKKSPYLGIPMQNNNLKTFQKKNKKKKKTQHPNNGAL